MTLRYIHAIWFSESNSALLSWIPFFWALLNPIGLVDVGCSASPGQEGCGVDLEVLDKLLG